MSDRDRFDKFTQRARKVLSLAREEAQRFQHNYIGTEHLLLGLVREGEGVAAQVLTNLGVELDKVRNAIEFIIGRGDRVVLGEVGLTPRAKKVIELAVDEARRLNHHYIGTEHLLLGIVREGEGIAAGVLNSLGVNLEKVRTQIIQVLSQSGSVQTTETAVTLKAPLPPSEAFKNIDNLAQEEALLLQHDYVGTEHLLLALLAEGNNIAAKILNKLGVELEKLRSAAELIAGRGERTNTSPVPLNIYATEALRRANTEATQLKHDHVGLEHLLLSITRIEESFAAAALYSLGINMEKVRMETLAALKQS
jgi:ATP-dependent Clp protease ATP-binding subunit ClpA